VIGHARQPLQRIHGLEVSAQEGIHAGAVEHGLMSVEVAERTLGQMQEGLEKAAGVR